MIPLVSTEAEIKIMKDLVIRTAKKIQDKNKMKIKLLILTLFFTVSLSIEDNDFPLKEYNRNGSLDALVGNKDDKLYLIQLDVLNDSLVERALSILPDLELYAGSNFISSYKSDGLIISLFVAFKSI